MLTVNNISFKGNFRYMGATIQSLDYAQAFEVGKNNVSKELVEFSQKSAFLNKLKEDKDVFLHHHKEILPADTTKEKGFFARMFSLNKTKNSHSVKVGNDHLSIVFINKKSNNVKETELCEIKIALPIKKGTPSSLDRFERILENNSDINKLRENANKLFPNSSHKLTLLPNNENHGWCEFWTGEKTSSETLDRLHLVLLKNIHHISEQRIEKFFKQL